MVTQRHDNERLSRRAILSVAGAAGLAAPFVTLSAARALTGFGRVFPDDATRAICQASAETVPLSGPPRKIKLAWNASAICTAAAPVAKERGVFAKHNLDVDFVNFGGSTEQLLEAIATGKADAGIGMALRWIKPLEQGFDVRITAGIHGGCLRLLGSKKDNITSLESLRGKTIAVSDQTSPAKNFFSVVFAKRGIDPVKEIEWRQYPAELLPLAVDKGEAVAVADHDPRTFLWLKGGNLAEVATNLSDEYASRTCCILALRGSLVRDDRPLASELTRAVLQGGELVAHNPLDAAEVFASYGGKGSKEDLAAMLKSHTHHDHVLGADLKKQIAEYADELKLVNVVKKSTNTAKYAERVYADVLS